VSLTVTFTDMALVSRIVSAATRRGLAPDAWVERRLDSYFRIASLEQELGLED
jgi:hypothetical protein